MAQIDFKPTTLANKNIAMQFIPSIRKCLHLICLLISSHLIGENTVQSSETADFIYIETNGIVAVEAEHFVTQTHTSKRKFYLTTTETVPELSPDGDPSHIANASGGAYLEVLPDSRRNHSEKLIKGENYSNEPGKLAVLSYKVHFNTPGRYYVWVRAYSSGSEDNGLHVGVNNTWPSSGQRLQWCQGKHQWRWESKQRTEENHCGEPHKIFLDIDTPGIHTIQFSMREDGFEFDKWLMTRDKNLTRPEDVGPQSKFDQVKIHDSLPLTSSPKSESSND